MDLAFLLLAASSVPHQASLPDLTIPQVDAKILASRREIHRGKLVFEWSVHDRGAKPERTRYTTWFDLDKGKNRTEYLIEPKDGDAYRRIECRNCEKAGYYVLYDERKLKDGKVTTLTLAPLEKPEPFGVLDPRLLGFLPDHPGALWHHHLETILGRGDRSNQTLKKDRLGDVDCYVITFETKTQQRYEYWAAPSKGYALLRIGLTNTKPGRSDRGVVENDLRQFERGGIWFPGTSTYTHTRGGTELTKAVVRVESAEFNAPIDDTAFTLAGMGLRKGLIVDYKQPAGKSELFQWTGQELEKYKQPAFILPKPPSDRRWWLYGLAGVLTALALGALFLYWRRRDPNRPLPRIP